MGPKKVVAKKGVSYNSISPEFRVLQKKKQQVVEEISEQENDEDLNVMDPANMGGIDQEKLTPEEQEKVEVKVLNSNNPRAP
jgi:hypothetical protein